MRIKTTIEIDYFVLNTDVINVSHKELHLQSVLAYGFEHSIAKDCLSILLLFLFNRNILL